MPLTNKYFKFVISGVIAFCFCVGMFSAVITIWSVGPAVERSWLPVVGKLQIEEVVEIEPGIVEVYAHFTKVRDCTYISVAWYVGNPNGDFRQVRVITIVDPEMLNEVQSPSRPIGTSKVGPWRIGMTLTDFEKNSFAILQHQCHPFWITTTNFWP
jgi:hypothetical protein